MAFGITIMISLGPEAGFTFGVYPFMWSFGRKRFTVPFDGITLNFGPFCFSVNRGYHGPMA